MGWAFRAVRAVVVLAVLGLVAVGVAPPASAATTSIDAVFVLPIATYITSGPSAGEHRYDGVAVGSNGLSQAVLLGMPSGFRVSYGLTIIEGDGSRLELLSEPGPASTRPLTVLGGTGRYSGASGAGTITLLTLQPPLGGTGLGHIALGSFSVQVTTP